MFRSTIILDLCSMNCTVYVTCTLFQSCILIREGYQRDYSWVRLPDLKPRCSAYYDLIEPVKKERNERLSVLSFANNKVTNDSVFSQGITF